MKKVINLLTKNNYKIKNTKKECKLMKQKNIEFYLSLFILLILTIIPIIWLGFFTNYEKGFWIFYSFGIKNNIFGIYQYKYYFWNRFYISYEYNCWFYGLFDLVFLYIMCLTFLLMYISIPIYFISPIIIIYLIYKIKN